LVFKTVFVCEFHPDQGVPADHLPGKIDAVPGRR